MFRLILVFGLVGWISVSHSAIDPKVYIPKNAYNVLPLIKNKQMQIWPDHPDPAYIAALIEHESCVSLTSPRCFSHKSSLKTAREEGAGLGQLTRAYNKEGKIRFDKLEEMSSKYNRYLSELTWKNVYTRPDLQVAAVILLSKENYRAFDPKIPLLHRLKFADASYNQGLGKTKRDRTQCGLKKNCDPNYWDNNVELIKSPGLKPLYGNRTAWDISRHHVKDVFTVRKPKYEKFLNHHYWSED